MNEDTLTEAINVAAVVALINQKFVENYENEDKQKVLTEVLNDVKLYYNQQRTMRFTNEV